MHGAAEERRHAQQRWTPAVAAKHPSGATGAAAAAVLARQNPLALPLIAPTMERLPLA